jgi:hypothetical protein
MKNERIIKCKERVQKHGEVLTPKWLVRKMLDSPGIREACNEVATTFLEPSAGEGAFLVEIMKRKLKIAAKKYNMSLTQLENYSLLALSSLYGIEILEDNTQICVMNMFQVFFEFYQQQAEKYGKKMKQKVLDSAKVIISANIVQGDFLTKKCSNNEPIVFSEWKPVEICQSEERVKVTRIEYTLDEIIRQKRETEGEFGGLTNNSFSAEQLSFFNNGIKPFYRGPRKFKTVNITEVYKEELADVGEQSSD